jgi:membrane fusion protein (multidrug efflux system)
MVYSHKGTFDAVERAIDVTTGTLAVQFSFANPDRLIRPGQYGRVRIMAEKMSSALLIPQRAVNEIQGFYQVAVVDGDNKVVVRNVKVGPRVDNLWVITEGIQPDEKIVAEGLQRVRNGVTVTPTLTPIASLSPPSAKQ